MKIFWATTNWVLGSLQSFVSQTWNWKLCVYVCIMTLKWRNDSSHIDSDCETNLSGKMNQTPKLETCDQGVFHDGLSVNCVCVSKITLSFLWMLYPTGCGRDPHKQTQPWRGNTFTAMCRPRLTPVKSCLAVLRLFTQTHTSPVPLHLWLHFNLSACGGVRTLVYVCCELDFLFCTLWETYVYNDLLTQKGDFYCVCVCTQTIPKTTHTLANTTHTHAHNPSHTHLPVDRGLRRWNPAAVTVVRRSSRISTETRAWLLSDPARLSSSGKKNAVRRRRERETEGGRVKEKEREGAMVWSWSRVGIFNNKH